MQTHQHNFHKTGMEVSLDKIDPDNWLNDRREDELDMDPQLFELVGSIDRRGGLIHPIFLIRKRDGRYKIGAGKRRFTAYKILNERYKDIDPDKFGKISATVVDSEEITSNELIAIAIDENSHRKAVWKVGVVNAIFTGIAEIAGCVDDQDDQDQVVQKGRNIFWYYYRLYVMQDQSERKHNLPCSTEQAVLAVTSFLDSTGLNAATIARKASITKMPDIYIDAMNAELISHTFAIRELQKLAKKPDLQKSMVDVLKEALSDKDENREVLKKNILEHYRSLIKPKNKPLMPKRTLNYYRKKTTIIVDGLSQLSKDDPRLEQVRSHLENIEKILSIHQNKGK